MEYLHESIDKDQYSIAEFKDELFGVFCQSS